MGLARVFGKCKVEGGCDSKITEAKGKRNRNNSYIQCAAEIEEQSQTVSFATR